MLLLPTLNLFNPEICAYSHIALFVLNKIFSQTTKSILSYIYFP